VDRRTLGETERKRAFVAVVVVVAAAVGLLAALTPNGSSSGGGPDRAQRERGTRKVVVRSQAARTPATPAGRDRHGALRAARRAARRFATSYLARESGTTDAATWRDLRAISTRALWRTLQDPMRVPNAAKAPRARLVRVSGISETASPEEVAATTAFRRAGATRYLRLVLVNEAGAWHVSRLSP
jgi:hypothetical protein